MALSPNTRGCAVASQAVELASVQGRTSTGLRGLQSRALAGPALPGTGNRQLRDRLERVCGLPEPQVVQPKAGAT